MRKSFLAGKCFAGLLLLCSAYTHGVVWQNNFTPDATDDDVILGETLITFDHAAVRISALTLDVLVTMTTGDTILQSEAVGNTRLYLNANPGRSITFVMDNSLTFRGAAVAAVPDLLVVVQGLGTVIFQMDGGKTLTLTSNGATGGNVQMFVEMDDRIVTLRFERNAVDPNPIANIEVVVEEGSILSYLASTAQPISAKVGRIEWDGTNAGGTGRLVLTIGQLGAVIVRGRLLNAGGNFTLADIDPATPAGFDAQFIVINNNAAFAGSLLVQNFNNTLGELIWDPWCNLEVRQNPPFGSFSGVQWGFIVGSYGTLEVSTDAYLDYVSLTGTQCPFSNPGSCSPQSDGIESRVKARNPSALFTDGQPDPLFTPPFINIDDTAGLYFRSGVDNEGNIRPLSGPNPYTIDPTKRTPGAGFIVFDIEGPLNIVGLNTLFTQLSKFELLSLEVVPTGGPLFDAIPLIFPLRTFTLVPGTDPCTGQDLSVYLSYNNASFLNNGRANLFNVSFDHTDQNHHVFENNDVTSEPAYTGGETWLLKPCMSKPKWAFVDSRFNIHTSVALTGVDLLVPNGSGPFGATCYDNKSSFVFYENGKAIDHGNGRQMILGTFVGSTACDGCTVINKDAQLDVMQTSDCGGTNGGGDRRSCTSPERTCESDLRHSLCLSTTQNDPSIVQGVPVGFGLTNQYSIQTIYLGNNSNISVGTSGSEGTTMEVTVLQQSTFPLTTCPELLINGNFFSFETRGGSNGIPSTSNVTGQGGIFVDMNGTFSIGSDICGYIANMGTMVTQSRNGVVDLPKSRVFFDPRIGIAAWNIDLSDPNQQILVASGRCLSDYNLNWMFVTKDYNVFCPYVVNCYDPCNCPAVTQMNVTDLPIIEGSVQQFQVQGSRIGDPVNLKIKGGQIEELVMLVGYNSAEAPVAVLVLEDGGCVGLGSTHRNVDSLSASVQLGVNGINVILNGAEGTVTLNEDVIVNNSCAFLLGPDAPEGATLHITSDCCKTLRISRDGVLDLSQFTTGQSIEFDGNVRVIFEPGATVLFGNNIGQGLTGPTMRFAENSTCEFQPVCNLNNVFTQDLTGTDMVRVKFAGVGVLEFADCSRADLPRNAFMGIESLPACNVPGTAVRLHLTDSASFYIGDTDCRVPGGVLQVGNTTDLLSPVVTFSLIIDGPEACFEVGPQGFFGLGVGIVSKPHLGHDFWQIASLANLQKVSFDFVNGKFRHAQVYAGSDDRSALVALSDSRNGGLTVYDFFTPELFGSNSNNRLSGTLLSNISVLGGADFIAVTSTASVFNPVVGIQNGFIDSNYTAGILASKPLFMRSAAFNVSAFTAQNFLRLHDVLSLNPTTNRAVVAPSDLRNELRISYVDRGSCSASDGFIARLDIRKVLGKTQQTVVQNHAKALGATQVALVPVADAGGICPRPLRVSIEAGN